MSYKICNKKETLQTRRDGGTLILSCVYALFSCSVFWEVELQLTKKSYFSTNIFFLSDHLCES